MRYIMALLLSLALAVPAFAGFEGPNASTGGFAGPGPQTLSLIHILFFLSQYG